MASAHHKKTKSSGATDHTSPQNGHIEDDTLSDPEMEAERQYRKSNSATGDGSAAVHRPPPAVGDHKAKSPRKHSGEASPLSAPPTGGITVPHNQAQSVLLPNGVVHVARAQKNQRKSRTGAGRGSAKKGGAGGKYTWGNPLQVYEGDELNDPNDPNYDSDNAGDMTLKELEPIKMEVLLEKRFEPVILEYFFNSDLREAVDAWRELKWSGEVQVAAIKYLIVLAMDHKDSARELTSLLIAELVSRRIAAQSQVYDGLTSLMRDEMRDLMLDYPKATDLLGAFAARALADLALPTDAIDEWKNAGVNEPNYRETIERAELLSKQKHRLNDIWGVGGGRRPVRFLSNQMQLILKEYLSSSDAEEAARCLKELEVPHFHHEFVYQAGVISLEGMHERPMRLLADLLKHLLDHGELSADAIAIGFSRLFDDLPDLCLDVPQVYALAEHWCVLGKAKGYLSSDVLRKLPHKGRKRFVSEGDGGRLKVSDVPHPYI